MCIQSIVLGHSVDKLLGIERRAEEMGKSTFAIVEHDLPYGTLELKIQSSKILKEYPIDQKTSIGVLNQLNSHDVQDYDKEGNWWISFATLNN